MKRFAPVLLAVLGGALEALALPLVVPGLSPWEVDPAGHLEWLAWLGLVPALAALERARGWKRALGLGLAAGLAYFYVAIYWVSHAMTEFGGLSRGLAFVALSLLVLYMAAHWAAAFAVSNVLQRRLGWPLWSHLPIVWAAAELLRDYLFTGFPWANLGYTQARHLAVAQLASVTGVYGIAALVVFVNCVVLAVLGALLERRRPMPWRLAGAAALLVAAVVAYGVVHLGRVRARMAASPRLRVGLVQANVDQSLKNEARRHAEYILGRLVPLTVEADRAGADLVAWPEAAYPYFLPPGIETLGVPGSGLPRLSRAHLLLGASTVDWKRGPRGRVAEVTNSVFLLRPDLSVAARYAKYHLVPFGEYVPLARWLPFVRQVVPDLAPASAGRALEVLRFPLPREQRSPGATPTAVAGPTAAPTSSARATSTAASGPGETTGAATATTATATATAATEATSPTATATTGPTATAPSIAPTTSAPTANGSGAAAGDPPASSASLAPMICFDAIFPEVNVAYAREDPEILVNPTNDAWYGHSSGPYQFLAIVRMRAIEAGKAVARPAYSGVSAVVLPTGEVAPGWLEVGPVEGSRSPNPGEPARLLLADVPRLHGRTLYTRFGDLFAYGCSALSLGALAVALARRRPAEA